MFSNLISLPLLEAEPNTLVRVVLIVSLILVVLDADEIRVYGFWIKREGDESVDRGCFGNEFECPRLFSPVRRILEYEYGKEAGRGRMCLLVRS